MNDKITCEKCGSEMRPIDSNKPVGMICPKCGWGWATSYIDPMRDDDTTYAISLSEGNSVTKATIQAIAKISNKNFVQAKTIIENSPMNIYTGKATQIKDILVLLDSLSLAYTITPEFPYSLSQEEPIAEN